jgi:hypothetical protein
MSEVNVFGMLPALSEMPQMPLLPEIPGISGMPTWLGGHTKEDTKEGTKERTPGGAAYKYNGLWGSIPATTPQAQKESVCVYVCV